MCKVSQLVSEISSLAVEITLEKKALVFVDYHGHVNLLDVRVYPVGTSFDGSVRREPTFQNRFYLEDYKSNETLIEIKSELEKYIQFNPFNEIWESFKGDMEEQIADYYKGGTPFMTADLFHDVMIQTPGHEISLDCVYQSYMLSDEVLAESFKKEMLSNIDWLTNMVESDISSKWSDDEVSELWNAL